MLSLTHYLFFLTVSRPGWWRYSVSAHFRNVYNSFNSWASKTKLVTYSSIQLETIRLGMSGFTIFMIQWQLIFDRQVFIKWKINVLNVPKITFLNLTSWCFSSFWFFFVNFGAFLSFQDISDGASKMATTLKLRRNYRVFWRYFFRFGP